MYFFLKTVAIVHLNDDVTYMHWETKKFPRLTVVLFTLLRWSWTKLTESPRYAYAAYLRLFYQTVTKKYFIKLFDFE